MKLYKFPIKLKELMSIHNISQKELADYLHTSQPTVNRWLKGENEPSLQTLVNICLRLKTTPNYILGYEDNDDLQPFGIEFEIGNVTGENGEVENYDFPSAVVLVPVKNGKPGEMAVLGDLNKRIVLNRTIIKKDTL